MDNQISVGFRVSGDDLSAYMDKIKAKQEELSDSALDSAREQNGSGKQQIEIIEQQIEARRRLARIEADIERQRITDERNKQMQEIEDKRKTNLDFVNSRDEKNGYDKDWKENKRNAINAQADDSLEDVKAQAKEDLQYQQEQAKNSKIQIDLDKEHIELLKQTAEKNIREIKAGNMKLGDVIKNAQTDDEKLVASLTEQGLAKSKKEEGKGILGSLLAVDNLNKMIGITGQLANSKNGFDMIKPVESMAGMVIGSIIGGIIGAFAGGVGAVAGASAGGSIGNLVGGTKGEFDQNKAMQYQEYLRSKNRLTAISGNMDDYSVSNMSESGVSVTDFNRTQAEFARRRGNFSSSAQTTEDAIYNEKAFGVDQGTSSALVELQRSAKEGNKDLAGLIGGIFDKGLNSIFKNDQTFLNEFLGKFTTLQRELLKTQTTIATGTTMDLMMKFNKVGGQFEMQDPRSQGLMSTINNAVSNPNGDFKKSMSFYNLRKNNPNMDMSQIIEEQQKGIASNSFKSQMDLLEKMGGSDSDKKIRFAGMFGLEGNQSAASKLYEGYKNGSFDGQISKEELYKKFPDLQQKAENNTNQLDKNSAKISNAILMGDAFDAAKNAFIDAITTSLSGAVIQADGGKIKLAGQNTIKANDTKRDSDKRARTIQTGSEVSDGIISAPSIN